MKTDRDLRLLLDRINWAFPESTLRDRRAFDLLDSRQLHWYPATFIPEIPYSLIEVLSQPGDSVFDPFAGTGTTAWQAELLGRQGFSLELNAVAAEIIRATWLALSEPSPMAIFDAVRLAVGEAWLSEPPTSLDERLRPWFSDGTYQELQILHAASSALTSPSQRGIAFIAISSMLRAVSEQRRGWGCVADNMKPRDVDIAMSPPSRQPITKVLQRVAQICQSLETFKMSLNRRGLEVGADHAAERLLQGDVLALAPTIDRAFDLIVTSPPYPGMMDYATSQRLSYYWLGLNPDLALRSELGARRRRANKNSLSQYQEGMSCAIRSLTQLVRPGGYLCLVLPEFEDSAREVERTAATQAMLIAAEESGMEEFWSTFRNLPTGRRQLNQGWARLQRERIVVYRRVGNS